MKVAEVMMPKLWPAPRTAQNRSLFSVAEAVRSFPSAVTMLTDCMRSMTIP